MHDHPRRRPSGREPTKCELTILNAIATALNESVDLTTSLGAALSRVADFLDLRTGWVWLLDPGTGEPFLATARNLPAGLREHPEALHGPCSCLDALRDGELSAAANVIECSRLGPLAEAGICGLRFHASVPLRARGEWLGVLNVASAEWRRLAGHELDLLSTIGDMVATAVERTRLYATSVEAGAMEERNRLAREIHDTLAQGLSATALHLEAAEALLESGADPDQLRRSIRRALDTTRENLEEARRSVLDLRAAPLRGRTLYQALEALSSNGAREKADPESGDASSASSAGGTSGSVRASGADDVAPVIHFERVGGTRPLPSRVDVSLYRVAQEALSNVWRHAEAETATVRIVTEPDRIILSITDDGRGFDFDAQDCDSFGLIGMRERVRLLGGELHVESAPGRGTTVLARVPLEHGGGPLGDGAPTGGRAPADGSDATTEPE